MMTGHIAVGMMAKRLHPQISLGTAVFAALWADFVAFVLLIARVERFDPVPGASLNRMIGRNIVFSHSLLMDALWAGLFAGIFFLRRRSPRGAWILFAAVVSHWVLDVASHRPDMPLAPGTSTRLGLGLWNSMPTALIVEGALWLLAIIIYLRATFSKKSWAIYGFWIPVILVTLIWRANISAGMDLNPTRAGIGGIVLFSLVVAWAYWMNRLRPPVKGRRRCE